MRRITEFKMHVWDKRISLTRVAHKLGMDLSYLSRIVNGYRKCPEKHTAELCELMGIDHLEFQKGKIKELSNLDINIRDSVIEKIK
jgi:hypothetical protein